MQFLAVDVGVRGCGVALFRDEALVRAAYVASPYSKRGDARAWNPVGWAHLARAFVAWTLTHAGDEGGDVVVELMKVYRNGAGHGSTPADLMQLQGVAGALIGWLDAASVGAWTPYGILARDWNGQRPRDVAIGNTREWLGTHPEWTERIDLPHHTLAHNTFSALGIARYWLEGGRQSWLSGREPEGASKPAGTYRVRDRLSG